MFVLTRLISWDEFDKYLLFLAVREGFTLSNEPLKVCPSGKFDYLYVALADSDVACRAWTPH